LTQATINYFLLLMFQLTGSLIAPVNMYLMISTVSWKHRNQ